MTISRRQTQDARELLGGSSEILAPLGVSSAAVALLETSGRLSKNLRRYDIVEILRTAGVEPPPNPSAEEQAEKLDLLGTLQPELRIEIVGGPPNA